MKSYIGIDLGTTNSVICSFDGEETRLYKSPDQHDVTPSAIYIDRRGNKYVGKRAYDNAARSPENAATLFKRLMGTSTPVKLPAANIVMTPEDCSAEILRTLFGYLPEEVRNDPETGTVITVPAAFNQMQKDATMAAAELAGLGKVALMQEPVAAVMSVMRTRRSDGVFLVYDLGGGTLDIAIAQSISGRVSLLAHGGIAMCGGRDFDRELLDNIVKPWLLEKFNLPEDFIADRRFATLRHMATWAAEKAKIELSAGEEAVIALDDSEVRLKDLSGVDIYLDIAIQRSSYDELIDPKVVESISAARETMDKAGLGPNDIGRAVFVGGPTQYKPLRDKVAFELGISASTDVNPMTAVAEGAAVFAESIDWSTEHRGRKSGRGALSTGGAIDVAFAFTSRTPDTKARAVVKAGTKVLDGSAFQIESLDTGWSSGKVPLKDGAFVELPLAKPGENVFKVWVFDAAGGPLKLASDRISITRTAAQIDAIPASHSIGIEAREKLGTGATIDYLVREGEQLPKKGTRSYKAAESLRAGAAGSIRLKVWEGNIESPVYDNRFVGMLEIRGSDFSDGVIAKGAELECEYEILDSGRIVLSVTVPSIGGSFGGNRNFYSRQEGQIDFTDAFKRIRDEAEEVKGRLSGISSKVADHRLNQAKERLDRATAAQASDADPEAAKQAMDDVQEAKKLMALARKEHLRPIREADLEEVLALFDKHLRALAKSSEISSFDNLVKTAQRAIESNGPEFESHLRELRGRNFGILWRQDWFVVDRFKWLMEDAFLFPDPAEHAALCKIGLAALQANDFAKLREVVAHMDSVRIGSAREDSMLTAANILVG